MKMDDINKTKKENIENNDISSLNTNNDINCDKIEKNNDKICSFFLSSKSSSFSFKIGKTDPEEIQKQKEKCRKNFCHFNNCFLIKMTWFFANFGWHRFIHLIFQCNICQKKIYIRMEKNNKGKHLTNIDEEEVEFLKRFLISLFFSYWEYIPKNKNKITYDDCIQYFDEASGDYHLINNNCKDFASYIWRKIKNKDKNK